LGDFAMSGLHVVKHDDVARYDIPAPLAREIGRFIVTWAHLEDYVQSIIWGTLELSYAQGRIAIREARITERFDIIRDLGKVQNIGMDFVLLKDIRNRADKLATKRHLLAHCVWQKPSGYWVALLTRGSWTEPQSAIQNYPSGSKAVEPEAVPITPEDVRAWNQAAIALMNDVEKLGDQHRLEPLPEKQKPRSVPKGQRRDRKGSGRRPQRPTSQE
jgi:hypothetical protein